MGVKEGFVVEHDVVSEDHLPLLQAFPFPLSHLDFLQYPVMRQTVRRAKSMYSKSMENKETAIALGLFGSSVLYLRPWSSQLSSQTSRTFVSLWQRENHFYPR